MLFSTRKSCCRRRQEASLSIRCHLPAQVLLSWGESGLADAQSGSIEASNCLPMMIQALHPQPPSQIALSSQPTGQQGSEPVVELPGSSPKDLQRPRCRRTFPCRLLSNCTRAADSSTGASGGFLVSQAVSSAHTDTRLAVCACLGMRLVPAVLLVTGPLFAQSQLHTADHHPADFLRLGLSPITESIEGLERFCYRAVTPFRLIELPQPAPSSSAHI